MLRPKIESLPDSHSSKALCLVRLSQLFGSVGNLTEEKRLLIHALALWRERGDDYWVASTLRFLCHVNRKLGLFREGIPQAKEALEICRQLKDTKQQAMCLEGLSFLLLGDNQRDAAEDTAFQIIDLLPEKGQEFQLCRSHQILGRTYHSKGEKEKAIHHLETALIIASPFDWPGELFWVRYGMASIFFNEGEFDNAETHIKQAKLHAADNPYHLARGMDIQALIWYRQRRLEDARLEALRVLESFEKLGAAKDVERCKWLLQKIEEAMGSGISGELDPSGEFPSRGTTSHQR